MNIVTVTFDEIEPVWHNKLWANCTFARGSHCPLSYQGKESLEENTKTPAWYYAIKENSHIVGTFSCHFNVDGAMRMRGLWVEPMYRHHGYGKLLIQRVIEKAKEMKATFLWGHPRQPAWNLYKSLGFYQTTPWEVCEESPGYINCYARNDLA